MAAILHDWKTCPRQCTPMIELIGKEEIKKKETKSKEKEKEREEKRSETICILSPSLLPRVREGCCIAPFLTPDIFRHGQPADPPGPICSF